MDAFHEVSQYTDILVLLMLTP